MLKIEALWAITDQDRDSYLGLFKKQLNMVIIF